MTPRQRALDAVSPGGRLGVELGPLNRPLIRRGDGDILYADHRSTDDLRAKYAGHDSVDGPGAQSIVEVDLVLEHQSLAEALGARAPVDYIVASHVLEHIPDPLGWLNELAAVLREDGVIFLAVPDKRFTFDFHRRPSTTGDLVGHHIAGAKIASPTQVFDYVSRVAKVDPRAVWAGTERDPGPIFEGQLPRALEDARNVAAHGSYYDAHCTVYTPVSFLAVFREVIELGLIPFEIARIDPTARNTIEFFVTLRKRADASPAARAAATPRLDPRQHGELPEVPVRGIGRRLALALRMLRTGSIRRYETGQHG
ncbi:class I SAM-dependent methyltransferase [Methylobacterium sp. J-076]|uniref:class I SAM-dependent methyltransferase n=1 Tax=Methylobacterium sp. J-076 TaxID=2836655 RepID=UPI001FBBAAB3|nr:methyltransferase domain-containing protein [Methylobacterium sp. J-076]MCJ2015256.1 class I SAM-dependent methyltransferase [Methylobacterium sp. J-076]